MNKETAPLRPDEAPKLLTLKDKRSLMYMAIAVYTGRRVSEIRTMKWEDLFDETDMKIYIPKQKKYMYFPKNPELIEIAKECYEGQPMDSYIFTGRRGADRRKPMSIAGINNHIIKPSLKKLGIKTRVASTHCIRKTFAVTYAEANKDLGPVIVMRDIQKYFGHKNIETSFVYMGQEEKMLQERINNMKLR